MERIVLGYDGTPASVSALQWVAARAARRVAGVDVVTVLPRFSRDREPALARLGDAEAYLRAHAPGVGVELHRLEGGVTSALTGFAEADLLVVGVNTGHPLRAVAEGALPWRLLALSRAPMVAVPPGWSDSPAPVTVGVADHAWQALTFAAREADALGVALRLVHSWQMPLPTVPGSSALQADIEQESARHRRALTEAAHHVLTEHPGLEVMREQVADDATAALLRYGQRSALLVVGTRRRDLIADAVRGSTAQQLLWETPCPLALVPETARRIEE